MEQTPQTVGRWILISVTVVMGINAWISSFNGLVTATDAPVKFAESFDATQNPVRLTAWVTEDSITLNKPFVVEISAHNASDKPAQGVLVHIDSSADWSIQPQVNADWNVPPPTWPAMDIAPGQTRSFTALATVAGGPSRQTLTILYSYSLGDDKQQPVQHVVALGPLRVQSAWRSFLTGVQGVITALMLPFLLGVLAWFVPWAEARSRADREAQAARMAEETAQANQTWNLLLPQSMLLAKEYYMPCASTVLAMVRIHKERPEATREILHAVLMFLRHMKAVREDVGGLHFKNRDGEAAAALCWKSAKYVTDAVFPSSLRERVLDVLSRKESYSQFEGRFRNWETQADFLAVEAEFDKWMAGTVPGLPPFAKCLTIFEIFRAITQYETNRPLEYWYREPEDSTKLRQSAAEATVAPLTGVGYWSEAVVQTNSYVRDHVR